MVKAAAAGYDITIEETTDTSKHSMNKSSIYTLCKNQYRLPVGTYTDFLDLHKRLKLAINYNFIDNNKSSFILSYNSRYFYIRHSQTKQLLGLPKEYVPKLSADMGRFIYAKMIANKTAASKKKK